MHCGGLHSNYSECQCHPNLYHSISHSHSLCILKVVAMATWKLSLFGHVSEGRRTYVTVLVFLFYDPKLQASHHLIPVLQLLGITFSKGWLDYFVHIVWVCWWHLGPVWWWYPWSLVYRCPGNVWLKPARTLNNRDMYGGVSGTLEAMHHDVRSEHAPYDFLWIKLIYCQWEDMFHKPVWGW